MVKDLCFNGTTAASTNKYSSPIPLVGLYIGAASMVCVLLIFCDVWAGFRRKKYWFPCRFFSINSVTLTLISIAAKIAVDLTTNMPSELDQLSKLCGTVFVCMSFMLPSLGTNAEFESYANVTALSIFVITVVVNIGIQMATGVIFSFKAEHAIVLVSMLVLLLCFWMSVSSLNAVKKDKADKSADLTRNGEENMVGRLKLCYIYSYHSCIHLYTCAISGMLGVYIICMTCSAVLIQATLRSLAWKELRFCEGVSDYAWSMRLVVASQFFAVVVVTFAIGGRWFIFLVQLLNKTNSQISVATYEDLQYFFSCRILPKFVVKIFTFLVSLPLILVLSVFLELSAMVHFVFFYSFLICGVYDYRDKLDEKSEAFKKQLTPRGVDVENWVLKKGVADVERWMEINGVGSLKHLTSLLSTVPRQENHLIVLV